MGRLEGSANVLVVEDDANALESMIGILELKGFRAAGARNGRAALDYLHTHTLPHLIISDLMMPEMDGWALREAIKKDPALASLPIVLVTASAAAKLDVDAILTKPIDIEQLFDTVSNVLGRRLEYSRSA